jgi:hypothetical protein
MRSLREVQKDMRDQALDRIDRTLLLSEIKDNMSFPPEERLQLYRNNTVLGLTDALSAAFPVVARLVGPPFFARLAGDFIRAHPPRQPAMLRYGSDFPTFLSGYDPAQSLPYLADVARLEAAWNHAYHAPEAVPLAPESLQSVVPDDLGRLTLALHPSLRFVASSYPVLDIWRANQDEASADQTVDLGSGAQRLIVYRPEAQVFIRPLGMGAFSFLMTLGIGQSLETAWESAFALDRDFDITAELSALLAGNIFIEARLT